MIIDTLTNAALYGTCLNGRMRKAFDYLAKTDFSALAPGKYEIDGKAVYAMVQQVETRAGEDGTWEAHRRYADVQFVVSGAEKLGYAPLAQLTTTQAYNDEKDCELFSGKGEFFTLKAGDFAIFFPKDGHMPCRAAGAPASVRKVVVKVAVA